jgi:hypothetical protein
MTTTSVATSLTYYGTADFNGPAVADGSLDATACAALAARVRIFLKMKTYTFIYTL